MAKKEKWDGRSRPTNQAYDEGYKRIFGKKPEIAEHEHADKVHAITMKGRNVKKKKKARCT